MSDDDSSTRTCTESDFSCAQQQMDSVQHVDTMAVNSGSAEHQKPKRTRRSSKKANELKQLQDKYATLEAKLEKYSSLESKIDMLNSKLKSPTHDADRQDHDKNVNNTSDQGGCRSPPMLNNTSEIGGCRSNNRPILSYTDNFPVGHFEENFEENRSVVNDTLSLNPSERERRDVLETEDSNSVVSNSTCTKSNNHKKERFKKYVKTGTTQEPNENVTNERLIKSFGDDAKVKSDTVSEGLILDQSQIEILALSWHTAQPTKLTSFKEEYRSCFPVHDTSEKHLNVPSLDDMVATLLHRKHGNRAITSSGKTTALYSPFMKGVEKLGFQGQTAARMGILANAYIQQGLNTLLESLKQKSPNVDKCIQQVRDIFAMSTKSLDQISRAGAFHHLIRRKTTLEDTGLADVKDLSPQLLALPLSDTGVLGEEFEKTLKDRTEKSKQLKDLLPELYKPKVHTGKRSFNTTHSSSNDWKSKKPKLDSPKKTVYGNSSYRIPKRGGFNRTSTFTRSDKTDKADKPYTGNSFRPNQGYQKK